ncbi:MAG: phosphoribosylformylglycinamidine synthase subunit PurL [Bernardetiaceae bacterium]
MEVSLEVAQQLGLLPEEYHSIQTILGRIPNFTELSIFSVMWSEHCSYKNSIVWLKKLPKTSPRMLAEAGTENAGLVDIGDGLACSFKIESHNHPSAIEPYQGAATGVGGINRDIFSMGARPIAQMNSLRFGNLHLARNKHLVRGVVKGIGNYGNAFGVPTVGGEVYFDDCYNVNPLVNAFSAGIVPVNKVATATASGIGNPVYIVGSATGKDGIHGATFASEDISEDSADKLPSVQVGDPFQEKLLLEATLEAIATGYIVGVQDMGAAGITCSTSEMSAKGNCGMDIWLDKVPTRQQNMKPFEILLSESQERMLFVIEKGKEAAVQSIFDKWDLNCAQIGVVTEGPMLNYFMHGECVAQVPAEPLVLGGGAPVYHRPYTEPKYYQAYQKFRIEDVKPPEDYIEVAHFLIAHPNIASRQWIYEQYDSMVGTANASTNAPSDAAVVHVQGTNKFLVMSLDCNSRYVHADPEQGAAIAVCEAARNVVCSGGEPVAITNCLNFGNPYVPEVYWQFVKSIEGMRKACLALETPVTGGNVSFYNQSSDEGPVFPTPTIGMLGLMEGLEHRMTLNFKAASDHLYLLGQPRNDISSSEYLYSFHQVKMSPAPYFDLDEECALQRTLATLIRNQWVASAHDVSDGGLWVALCESAMPSGLGFAVRRSDKQIRRDAFWFGEAQSRVLVSVSPEKEADFLRFLQQNHVVHHRLGEVTQPDTYIVDGECWGTGEEIRYAHRITLEKALE